MHFPAKGNIKAPSQPPDLVGQPPLQHLPHVPSSPPLSLLNNRRCSSRTPCFSLQRYGAAGCSRRASLWRASLRFSSARRKENPDFPDKETRGWAPEPAGSSGPTISVLPLGSIIQHHCYQTDYIKSKSLQTRACLLHYVTSPNPGLFPKLQSCLCNRLTLRLDTDSHCV